MPRSILFALLGLLLASGCSKEQPEPFPSLVKEFVYTALSFTPVSATSAGYHNHGGIPLDDLLDSYDEIELNKIRDYLKKFRERLDRSVPKPAELSAEDRADYDILLVNIQQWELELNTIKNYQHNPTLYVELIGNGLFNPMVLEYAPAEKRFLNIIERLKRVPSILGQARKNLKDAPEIWIQVARQENDGNYDLVHRVLREKCPVPLKQPYNRAAGEALRAISEFTDWMKNDLMQLPSDWRLGKEKYAAKFGPVLGLGMTPEQLLSDAEAELTTVRQKMMELALLMHEKMYPGKKDRSDINKVVSEVLARIAEKHATPQTYFADARGDLAEARAFVKAKGVVTLPQNDNLEVIETPEFMRGIYSVGGFNSAPPLEPNLGAFYWLTPIPSSWPPERIASKLREYNTYGLKLLTIHEAIPGHYLQFEYANRIKPIDRKLLRGVFGNGPYIEGWAVYATEMMLDEGYLDNDPQLRLTFLKQQLRMIANTILDVRLQTMNMTDQQALDLMINQCFQEKEEATGKLRRAQLSSVQLPTYYAGWKQWRRIRDLVKAKQGSAFNLAAFHEKALNSGAVLMPSLERLMTAQ